MDVLIIKPEFKNEIALIPPLGLCSIAATVREKGYSVEMRDYCLFPTSDDQIIKEIGYREPRVIGIGSTTPSVSEACRLAKLIKSFYPDVHLCAGGVHASNLPGEMLNSGFDSVCIGEAEHSFAVLVKAVIRGFDIDSVTGVVTARSDLGQVQGQWQHIQDLDALPTPAYDLLPMEAYFRRGKTYGVMTRSSRTMPILSTRGCPAACTFCHSVTGKQVRFRSPRKVVEEIETWVQQYGIREIQFLDDNFTLMKSYALDICREIQDRKLNIRFWFPNGVREDNLDDELLIALKQAGCYALFFGLESGSQRVLDLMKKNKRPDKMQEKVMLCKRYGFKIAAAFLFGTPGETLSEMQETIRFACSLPLDSVNFLVVNPYPGTEIRTIAEEMGYLKHSEWDVYDATITPLEPAIETPDFSASDLRRIQKQAYRQFYLRPRVILKSLPNMLKWEKFRKYVSYINKYVLTRF